MTKLKIAIIVGTTRQGRFADRPVQWIFDLAGKRGHAAFEIVDLRDYPMPFFDELISPAWAPPKNEVAQTWARKVAEFDGFIFVTAEYNHSIPAVLKNAMDYAYTEFNRKPAAFIGYGGVGGARAIEQLRLIAIELQLAPLKKAVHIGTAEYLGLLKHGKTFADYPHLVQGADALLDDLLWWTSALKTARTTQPNEFVPV